MLTFQIVLALASVGYGLFAIAQLSSKQSPSFALFGRRLPKWTILVGYALFVIVGLAAVGNSP